MVAFLSAIFTLGEFCFLYGDVRGGETGWFEFIWLYLFQGNLDTKPQAIWWSVEP